MRVRLPVALVVGVMAALGAGEARADVIPTCLPAGGTPECSDGVDNDGDGLVDGADGGCVSALDWAEGVGGYQSAPCHRVDIFLLDQFLAAVNQWPPVCPECGLSIIDYQDLITDPLKDLIEGVHPDWRVSVVGQLATPVQGIQDSPNIPNLRFTYVGKKALGPGALRTLFKFRGDPEPQPNLQYVGRAFDARTGKQVVNIGLLNPAQ